jgi:uncharacterized protein
MALYAPQLPLALDPQNGYKMLDTLRGVIKQNFRMLLLTMPGERMMIPDFGVGIRGYLFEPLVPTQYTAVKKRILSQAKKYLPFVEIMNINFYATELAQDFASNTLQIRVEYKILPLNATDVLNVSGG